METTKIEATDLLSKEYVLYQYEIWCNNMGEKPTTDQLTRALWWIEEKTNEYEIEDEESYFNICYDYVKNIIKKVL